MTTISTPEARQRIAELIRKHDLSLGNKDDVANMLLLNNHRGRGETIDDVEVLINLVEWLQERGLEP
jgi:hypothetical protein